MTQANHQHSWSGWPGAWCKKCGQDDLYELGLADDTYNPFDGTWEDLDCLVEFLSKTVCKVPTDPLEEDILIEYVDDDGYQYFVAPTSTSYEYGPIIRYYWEWDYEL